MVLAGEWYASEVFWAAVGVLSTLVTASLAVLVAYRVGTPKRRLAFGIYRSTPLLTPVTGRVPQLEIRHNGTAVQEPLLVEFKLVTRGRQDIPSSCFDAGSPMTFDMGVPIVEVLEATTQPATSPPPCLERSDTALKVGPSLLKKQQTTTFTLLVDGTPTVSSVVPLEGVDLRRITTAPEEDRDANIARVGGALSGYPQIEALVAVLLGAFRTRRRPPE